MKYILVATLGRGSYLELLSSEDKGFLTEYMKDLQLLQKSMQTLPKLEVLKDISDSTLRLVCVNQDVTLFINEVDDMFDSGMYKCSLPLIAAIKAKLKD